jgi:hypothetical protein
MSIFKRIKDGLGFKSQNAGNKNESGKKTHDIASLVALIGTSKDKQEIKIAVAIILVMAKALLDKGKDAEAKGLILGVMNLINNRNDDVFGLDDAWEIITKGGLRDFTNKLLGTQL